MYKGSLATLKNIWFCGLSLAISLQNWPNIVIDRSEASLGCL
jgi:hypothetical protein